MRGLFNKFTRTGVIALIGVAALAGCQSGAPGAPSAAPSAPSASPAASAPASSAPTVDPLSTVTALTVGPELIALRDDNGTVVLERSYDDPVDAVVAELAVAFGADPVVEAHDAELESPAWVDYQWDGFLLFDFQPEEGHFTGIANFGVKASAQAAGPVTISTPGGFTVGDDLRAAASTLGIEVDTTFESHGDIFYFELGPLLDTPPGEDPSRPNAFAVQVSGSTDSGAIKDFQSIGNLSFQVH